ncbi:hypothetical protein [Streptomyces griseosporeus]|uniref:hypothetical protein n=1 Tax=Streptomyces griseosporeus TaxID=1910 RepID=UPI0036FDF752
MSGEATHSPLAAVQALESGAFRLGQVMRRLLAEHPGLPIHRFRPEVIVSAYLDEEAETKARAEIGTGGIDSVRSWAEALGGEATVEVMAASTTYAFEHAEFTASIDGVDVTVIGTRPLSDAEAAAWRAEQAAAAEGGER